MAVRGGRGRGSRVSRGTPRRKLVWARHARTDLLSEQSGTIFTNLLSDFEQARGADLLGVTIMRIRGSIAFTDTGAASIVSGIRIFTESTLDDLQTMPNGQQSGPALNPHADWMMWEMMHLAAGGAESWIERVIDVRSRRKLDELGQGLLLSTQRFAPELPTGNTFVRQSYSVLLALP